MSDRSVWTNVSVSVDSSDPKKVTFDADLGTPIDLTQHLSVKAFSIHVGRDGAILMGSITLSEDVGSLSVSPESLEAPPDEGWQG